MLSALVLALAPPLSVTVAALPDEVRLPEIEIAGPDVDLLPDDWMSEHAPFSTIAENRQAYVDYLTRRLDAPRNFVEEAIHAR